MKNPDKRLKTLIEENDGVVSPLILSSIGIDRKQLSGLVASNILAKESHGYYVAVNHEPDEYKLIQNRSDKIIFSHGTALFLQGLSDRVPHIIDITVPQGDNISRIKKTYPDTRFHYCKKEIWYLGMLNIDSPQGYRIKVYDLERCICDLIKDKENVDKQIYVQAIQEYFKKYCVSSKIIKYARIFNIETAVRNYLEILR